MPEVVKPEPKNSEKDKSRRPNGLTDEQVKELLAAAGRRKEDSAYLESWDEGIAEYRRRLQEELEQELSQKKTK
jgi:hypothetical protein